MVDFPGRQNKISLMCVVLLQCKSSGIVSSTYSSSNNAPQVLIIHRDIFLLIYAIIAMMISRLSRNLRLGYMH